MKTKVFWKCLKTRGNAPSTACMLKQCLSSTMCGWWQHSKYPGLNNRCCWSMCVLCWVARSCSPGGIFCCKLKGRWTGPVRQLQRLQQVGLHQQTAWGSAELPGHSLKAACSSACCPLFSFFFLSSFFFFPLIKTTFTVGEVEKTSSVLPDSKWLSRNSELYKARWFSRFDLNPAIASGQCPSVAEKRRITKRTVKIPSL